MSFIGIVVMWCLNWHFLDGAFCYAVEVRIQVSKFKDTVLSFGQRNGCRQAKGHF